MPIDFSNIEVGSEYSRSQLAKILGHKDHNAIRRGIVTPRDQNACVLFITRAHSEYSDSYDGKTLEMDGERKHGSDARIVELARLSSSANVRKL